MSRKSKHREFRAGLQVLQFLQPGSQNILHGGVGVASARAVVLPTTNSTQQVHASSQSPAPQPPAKQVACQDSQQAPEQTQLARLQRLKADFCYLNQQIIMLDTYLATYRLTGGMKLQADKLAAQIRLLEQACRQSST